MNDMRFLRSIGISLAAALSLASCAKMEMSPYIADSQPFFLFADTDGTRTTNDGLSTKWAANDHIALFCTETGLSSYSGPDDFELSSDPSGKGGFSGLLSRVLDEDAYYDWYVLYPYVSGGSVTESIVAIGGGENGMSPQAQNGNSSMAHLAGANFPLYGRALAVAGDAPVSVTMSQAVAVVKFVVKNDTDKTLTVSDVSLTAAEKIVGLFKMDISKETASFKVTDVNSTTAALSVVDGEGIEPGSSADFYVALKPFTAKAGSVLKLSVNGYSKDLHIPEGGNVVFAPGTIKQIRFSYDNTGADSFELVKSLSDITPGDYVITNGDYVLLNSKSSSAPLPVLTADKATINGTVLTTSRDEIKWKVRNAGDGRMYVKSYADSNNFLYVSGANNDGIRVGATSDSWSFSTNDGAVYGFSMCDTNNSRYCAIYVDAGTPKDWRSYTTAQHSNYGFNKGALLLYKKSSSSPTPPDPPVVDDVTYVLDFPDDNSASNKVGAYDQDWTAKKGALSWTISAFNNNNWNSWTSIKAGRKTGKGATAPYIATATPLPAAIRTVTVTYGKVSNMDEISSPTLTVASNAAFTANVSTYPLDVVDGGTAIASLSNPAAGLYYKISYSLGEGSGNGFLEIVSVSYSTEGSVVVEPVVTTGAAGSIGLTEATLSASYASASSQPQEVRFLYGTSSTALNSIAYYNDGGLSAPSGNFSVKLTSLRPSTTYWYRAVIQFGDKDYYGSIISFTTGDEADPTIQGWLELPAISGNEDHVETFYSGSKRNYTYNYEYSSYTSLWVAYPLYSSTTGGSRSGSWSSNPSLHPSYQVNIWSGSYGVDYGSTIYARGHQIPDADRSNESTMQSQTYYATNSTPQIQTRFNDGIWSSLENAVRDAIPSGDTLYVVTGAVFNKINESKSVTIIHPQHDSGKSVPVPNYYWKALLKVKRSGKTITSASAVGVWLEHKQYEKGSSYTSYTVSVDQIEAWTGFDLFTALPDTQEASAETNSSWSVFSSF